MRAVKMADYRVDRDRAAFSAPCHREEPGSFLLKPHTNRHGAKGCGKLHANTHSENTELVLITFHCSYSQTSYAIYHCFSRKNTTVEQQPIYLYCMETNQC